MVLARPPGATGGWSNGDVARHAGQSGAAYPQPSSQKPGLGFPQCRLVGIICLASGAVLNTAMGPCKGKGSDEQSLLRSILDTLESGDILLGDAFYATYFLLCPKQTSKVALKRLYRDRWHIELDLRNIKTTLGMEKLSCLTPGMIEKEIWVYLLAYNLIRLLMCQSALSADLLPRQLSFKHTLQLWVAWRQSGVGCDDDKKLANLFILIAQQKVGDRPRRIEPRAIKQRPKPFPLLMKRRQIAREEVRKNGHPKKLK